MTTGENVTLEYRPFLRSQSSSLGSFNYGCKGCGDMHRAAMIVDHDTPTASSYEIPCPDFKGTTVVSVIWPSYAAAPRPKEKP
jgi:hypothetical protein